MANRLIRRIVSSFLAFSMILTFIPIALFKEAYAQIMPEYSVAFYDGEGNLLSSLDASFDVTMTNTSLSSVTETVTYTKDNGGKVSFDNFATVGETYSITFGKTVGYEIQNTQVTIDGDRSQCEVTVEELETVTVLGTVKNANGDKAMGGVTVSLGEYADSYGTTTDENGRYSVKVNKNVATTFIFTPAADDMEHQQTATTKTYSADSSNEDVNLPYKSFDVTTSVEGGNGTISDSCAQLYGGDVSVQISANAGYCIESVTVNDTEIPDAVGKKNYTAEISNITENKNVVVKFAPQTYKITFTVDENGDVIYGDSSEETVAGGSVAIEKSFNESTDPANPTKVTVRAKPNENYRVSKVVLDGTAEEFTGNDKEYEKTLDITKDYTFAVEFSLNQYTLNVTAGEGGSASWSESEAVSEKTVEHGGSATLVITPESNFVAKNVKVNGAEQSFEVDEQGKTVIVFENIVENKTVTVEFSEPETVSSDNKLENKYYKITFSEDEIKAYQDGEYYTVVLAKDATACIQPISPYTSLKINSNHPYGSYEGSLTLTATTDIKNILVKSGNSFGEIWNTTVKVRLIIDKIAPELADITDPDWTNEDSVTVSGEVSDEGGSGVSYIVWSKDKELTEDEIINAADTNKCTVTDGKYSFTSTAGEQNSTYYVYAVDLAGNISEAKTVNIGIDKTVPLVNSFVFSSKKDEVDDSGINYTSYATVSGKTMYLTVKAAEQGTISSGVASISLYCGGKLYKTVTAVNGEAVFELTEEKFSEGAQIYAVATDNAGNNSVSAAPTGSGVSSKAKSNTVQISDNKPSVEISLPDAIVIDKNKWYSGDVKFTVRITDKLSGISRVTAEINGKSITADLKGRDLTGDFSGGTDMTTGLNFDFSTASYSQSGKNTVKITAVNAAGVKAESTEEIYIDTAAPDVTGFEIETLNSKPLDKVLNFLSFGIFCNEQVKITVTAKDNDSGCGVAGITLYLDGKEYQTAEADAQNKAVFVIPASALGKNTVFEASLSAVAADNVNNKTQSPVKPSQVNSDITNDAVMIENVKPTVTLSLAKPTAQKNSVTGDKNDWYNRDVKFRVTVKDADSGIRSVTVTVNDKKLVEKSYNGDEAYDAVYEVSTAKATAAKDGSYKISIEAVDNAGNSKSYTRTIYKDSVAPNIVMFDFKPTNYIEGSEIAGTSPVIPTDYGFYFAEDTDVVITASDEAPTSGIKAVTYYTVDFSSSADGVKSEEKTVFVNSDNAMTVTIPADFKGQLYALATDNAGNTTDFFVAPDGVIVESPDKHDKEGHITFDMPKTSSLAADGTALYAQDTDVKITVTDTYSGIREIEWSVEAPFDTANNQSGRVTLDDDGAYVGGIDGGWIQSKTDANLVTEMYRTVKVTNNSNGIVVKVKMTDRAGNTTEKQIKLSIDRTAPVIEITFGADEKHDSVYTDFFSTARSATVRVYERNFSASDITSEITNTDGQLPVVDLTSDAAWSVYADEDNPDNTVYTATVVFNADGDYTFDISCKDSAGNAANNPHSHSFTIDMTKPAVSVSYDNNSALNNNYFNKERTATITVTEHNFDASRVNIIGTATDNGVNAVFPAISEWTASGDTHTAVIVYNADGKYTFDIEVADKASNNSDNFTPVQFYLDKTAPTLEISGVADKSANAGDVIPVVSFSDTNFDANSIVVTLTGVNNGAVKYEGVFSDIANGREYVYDCFEKIKETDDIYTLKATLTDKAGNKTEKSITFSVNRFGSVYDISKLESINGSYLKEEKDIVITETNVDTLDREGIVIKLVKNGTPSELKEGEDYTVEASGGNGEWSVYTYTIKKALFADDGRYSLTFYSKDAAGNVNENIDEAKKAEISFGIDKTAPVIVPVDIESGMQYAQTSKSVSVEIKDNLVLDKVQILLNGNEISYSVNGELYTFDIPERDSVQALKIIAVDAAGNEYPVELDNILVTTNFFVRWYNNTQFFVTTIVAVAVLILGVIILIILRKRRKINNGIKE